MEEKSIGNMRESDPEDIRRTRQNFRKIGMESGEEDRPYIDKPLDNAIRGFQRETGLKEDGIMNPKGETESVLNLALAIHDKEENQRKTPPTPPQKPKFPPIPKRKSVAKAKAEAREKARNAGELASELFLGRLSRIPVRQKNFQKLIKNTVGKGKEFTKETVEKLFYNYFEEIELEKEKIKRQEKIEENK